MAVTGKPCVNRTKNEKSFVILHDPDGRYSKDTVVKTVKDNKGVTYKGDNLFKTGDDPKHLPIRLKSNGRDVQPDKPRTETGDLTVTLEMPAQNNTVPVVFVNDP